MGFEPITYRLTTDCSDQLELTDHGCRGRTRTPTKGLNNPHALQLSYSTKWWVTEESNLILPPHKYSNWFTASREERNPVDSRGIEPLGIRHVYQCAHIVGKSPIGASERGSNL